MDSNEKYIKAIGERQKYVDLVLNSKSQKRVVVAGPGTGKTYLFKEILKNKKNSLTLTFVNALVEDLSLELCGISEVKTLHGFARSILGEKVPTNIKIFPKLSEVIKEDIKILLNQDVDFDHIFYNRDDKNEYLDFYIKRKNYYDKHYGYSDIIYAAVRYFENKEEKLPVFEQIVVDEFQDFNELEVSFIDLLAKKSPILVAGDDDQALYSFKDASPNHIRQRYDIKNTEYDSFTLPYCSRCTNVIIEATNDIINQAINNKNLSSRIKKEFKYFDDEKKDKECICHPKITYSQVFAKKIPWFIEQQIKEIAKLEKNMFSVLIISPTKVQVSSIVKSLKSKGFKNVQFVEKNDDKKPSLLDGLKILLENNKSNLGWRIVCKTLLDDTVFINLINDTNKDGAKNIYDIIDKTKKDEVGDMLKILKAINNDKSVNQQKLNELLTKINIDPFLMAKEFIKNNILSDSKNVGNVGIKKIPIKTTTIQSSKGLAAEYVFIVNFDDQYFIKDKDKKNISDHDICSFVVALTRARKKVFLISSNTKKIPTFLTWINKNKIEKI